MGYRKAEEILPNEVIELIQEYVDGTNIYIPRKQDHKRKWGTKTAYRRELQKRNQSIYTDYLNGICIHELAERYYLSEKSIQRIIRQEKASNVS